MEEDLLVHELDKIILESVKRERSMSFDAENTPSNNLSLRTINSCLTLPSHSAWETIEVVKELKDVINSMECEKERGIPLDESNHNLACLIALFQIVICFRFKGTFRINPDSRVWLRKFEIVDLLSALFKSKVDLIPSLTVRSFIIHSLNYKSLFFDIVEIVKNAKNYYYEDAIIHSRFFKESLQVLKKLEKLDIMICLKEDFNESPIQWKQVFSNQKLHLDAIDPFAIRKSYDSSLNSNEKIESSSSELIDCRKSLKVQLCQNQYLTEENETLRLKLSLLQKQVQSLTETNIELIKKISRIEGDTK